jgi:DNA-binding IclR family transcriptional regulator
MRVLETLTQDPGMTHAEIARSSKIAHATLHRILATLITHGYIQRDGTGRMYCGDALTALARRAVTRDSLVVLAAPTVDSLSRTTKETVHLAEALRLDHAETARLRYLHKRESTRSLRVAMQSSPGTEIPWHSTALGKSVLASLPETTARSILESQPLAPFTAATNHSLREILDGLHLVRDYGYALDQEENEVGICCIGAAILDGDRLPVGAISISVPSVRFTGDTLPLLSEQVLQASGEISRLLRDPSSVL